MRCRRCDYPLWNLKTRTCPECGELFAPSQYEFVANSVCFCCPHCDQQYYGVGEKGQLSPRRFECVRCHNEVDMDEMVLRPADGVREEKTIVDQMPWLQRKDGRWFKCWWQTVWKGMVAPTQLARGLHRGAPAGDAWWFAIVTLGLCVLGGLSLPFLVMGMFELANGTTNMLELGLEVVGAPIIYVLIWLLNILLWGLCTHGLLYITGSCTRTLSQTWQALCYSAGPNIFTIIPCLGFNCIGSVSYIWWIVSAILMVMAVQQVRGWRASCAVLVYPILFLILLVGSYIGGMIWMFNSIGTTANWASNANNDAQRVMTLLTQYEVDNGAYPEHAVQLMYNNGSVSGDDFTSLDSNTYASMIPNQQRQDAIDDFMITQPTNMIAHRLGDFVFTYHGMDQTTMDPNLWVFLMIEDPDQNATFQLDPVMIGRQDGFVYPINRSMLPTFIQNQNVSRQNVGLPPLPIDLETITHDAPATAASEQ